MSRFPGRDGGVLMGRLADELGALSWRAVLKAAAIVFIAGFAWSAGGFLALGLAMPVLGDWGGWFAYSPL